MEPVDVLERGREAHGRRAWKEAYAALSRADRTSPLGADDVELLANAAYLLGRDDDYLRVLERAHHGHLDGGDLPRAVRCAFWLGLHLAVQGELGPASGWWGRAERLLDRAGPERVERGYLLLPLSLRHERSGEYEASHAVARDAAEIGERFGDADLMTLAVHQQGCVLVKQGRVAEGLRLLDQAMVGVISEEVSPIVAGLVYCGVIDGCQLAHDVRRAQEWTEALTRWCEAQPDLVPYTGQCLVHRAEILQLRGDWPNALEEARRAGERFAERMKMNRAAAAQAFYRQGEVHRLRGDLRAAEDAYRKASRAGWEPQPGLALLRLAQGRPDAGAAALRRALGETTDRARRSQLLPAYIELTLATGEIEPARAACRELEEILAGYPAGLLTARLADARGALHLVEGDARAALVDLRRAWRTWQELEAPYDAARTRLRLALACRALGDEDTAALELEAARGAFAELGALPELARIGALTAPAACHDSHGLTARELQVLRLVAAGQTNKAIAAGLVLSERTVDRHVSNIFAKLGVSSRAAATAYAYEHQLVSG
ncbi:MAG TPA: LuxR C-terminal-related transcriptional regulator [Solirubrobacteraceae bacterium]|nr:LuxR C-terminal-related transcriptional regulator [Solirubrobacteraceae bacterium]